jgi:hypothetical protein
MVTAGVGWIAMRRLGVIAALGALLVMLGGVVTVSPALARGPQWQLVPAEPFTILASHCGFDIGVTFPTNKEFVKVLKTSDGSMTFLITGLLSMSYTNLSTGKTITKSLSGPGTLTVASDGSAVIAAKGVNSIVLTPADAERFGLPAVSVTAGALTESFALDGSITSVSLRGHVLVDVCAALSLRQTPFPALPAFLAGAAIVAAK